MSSVPMIYNIPTGQWVHDFVISGPLSTLTTATVAGLTSTNNSSTPTPTGPASTSSSLTSGGAIGGAIGGVVILAVFGIFFYRRHRLHRHNRTNKPLTSSSIVNSEGEHHRPSSKDLAFAEDHDEDSSGRNKYRIQLYETNLAITLATSPLSYDRKPLPPILSTNRPCGSLDSSLDSIKTLHVGRDDIHPSIYFFSGPRCEILSRILTSTDTVTPYVR